jgi:putative SbcD/Mre11-related phosphoesterase
VIEVSDDVTLHAPGGAYLRHARALVVADLHAGYVDTLRHRGHALPPLDDGALLARVDALLGALDPVAVLIAGDLVHGAAAAHTRGGASALDALLARLRGRDVTVVPGNHDRAVLGELTRRGVRVDAAPRVGPHSLRHGDEGAVALRGLRDQAAARGGFVLLGHLHPALGLRGAPGVRARLPAFAWCPGLLALPALSPLARGADLLRDEHAEDLLAVVDATALRVAVVIGAAVKEVGILSRVRAATRGG